MKHNLFSVSLLLLFNTAIAAVMEFMNALAKFDDATPQGRAVT